MIIRESGPRDLFLSWMNPSRGPSVGRTTSLIDMHRLRIDLGRQHA